jgi:DtxR family Mn-dependent transcriptional regulator
MRTHEGEPHHSQILEDYVLAIYRISVAGESVRGARLAEQLGVAPPTVTEMIGRLRRDGLVAAGQPVRLSDEGLRLARTLVSRHRLAERFLVDKLGFGWEEVHEEAHRLEHAMSARVTERLAEYLGHPSTCPHGHPIMEGGAAEPDLELHPLTAVAAGDGGVVRRIAVEDPALLGLLSELGIGLDTEVRVERVDPYDGPMHIAVRGREAVIGVAAAREVLVETR